MKAGIAPASWSLETLLKVAEAAWIGIESGLFRRYAAACFVSYLRDADEREQVHDMKRMLVDFIADAGIPLFFGTLILAFPKMFAKRNSGVIVDHAKHDAQVRRAGYIFLFVSVAMAIKAVLAARGKNGDRR